MVINTAKLLISDQSVSPNNVTKQFEEKILEIEKEEKKYSLLSLAAGIIIAIIIVISER